MTVAKHEAIVLEGVETGEGNAWAWEGWPAVRDSLTALVTDANRAAKLEAVLRQIEQDYLETADPYQMFLTARAALGETAHKSYDNSPDEDWGEGALGETAP